MSNPRSKRKTGSQARDKGAASTSVSVSSTPASLSNLNVEKKHQTTLMRFIKPVSGKRDGASTDRAPQKSNRKRRPSGGDTSAWLYGDPDTDNAKNLDRHDNAENLVSPTISPFSAKSGRSLETSTDLRTLSSPIPGISLFGTRRADGAAREAASRPAPPSLQQLRKRKSREWETSAETNMEGQILHASRHLSPSLRPNFPKRSRQAIPTSPNLEPQLLSSLNPIPKSPTGHQSRSEVRKERSPPSTSPDMGFKRLFDDVEDGSCPLDASPPQILSLSPVKPTSSTIRTTLTDHETKIVSQEILPRPHPIPDNIMIQKGATSQPNSAGSSQLSSGSIERGHALGTAQPNRRVIPKRRTRERSEAFLLTISPDRSTSPKNNNQSSTPGKDFSLVGSRVQKIRRTGRHTFPSLNAHSIYNENTERGSTQKSWSNTFALPLETTNSIRDSVSADTTAPQASDDRLPGVLRAISFEPRGIGLDGPKTPSEANSSPCVLSSQPLDDGPFWETQPLLDIDRDLPTCSPIPVLPATSDSPPITLPLRGMSLDLQQKSRAKIELTQRHQLGSIDGGDDDADRMVRSPKRSDDFDITLVAKSPFSTSFPSPSRTPVTTRVNSSALGAPTSHVDSTRWIQEDEGDVTLVAPNNEIISSALHDRRRCDISQTPDSKGVTTGDDIGALVTAVRRMSPYKKRSQTLPPEKPVEGLIVLDDDSDGTEMENQELPPSTAIAASGASTNDWFSKYSPSMFESQLPEEEPVRSMSLPPGWNSFETPKKPRHPNPGLVSSNHRHSGNALMTRLIHAIDSSPAQSTVSNLEEYGADDAFGPDMTPSSRKDAWPEVLRRFEEQPSPFVGMFSGSYTSTDEEDD